VTPINASPRGGWLDDLLRPIDGAWLAAFRIGYGLALAVSMWRFIAYGWVTDFFVRPTFFFKYWGFEWVQPLPEPWLYALFWGLVGAALCMAAGFLFRIASALFALGLIYVQLIDVSTYLNHYYLAALLAILLAVSPAHRCFAVDAWLARRRESHVSAAWLYLFRTQVGAVYVFAGLAKLQSDWLLHAQPLRIWLAASTSLPWVGPLLMLPGVPLVFSWCGFVFDTTVVGFLLWPRARPYAYAVLLAFHAMTRVLFPIGMFPVIMSLAALVFFSPSWPRRLWRGLGTAPSAVPLNKPKLQRTFLWLGASYLAVQVLLPFRYLAYGGNVLWHEQGMRFSWRVMVRAKGGGTTFVVYSPLARHSYDVSPREYLTRFQESEMSSQPDLILQLAHHIHDDFQRRGYGDVEVRAQSRVGLNGRKSAPFVDESVNLAQLRDGLAPARFVLPSPSQPPVHTRPVL